MKTQKTPQEKFKAGLKKSGYDPDAGAKRLLDLIAKQKKEREEFESKYKSAYEGKEMKTLKQIIEGTVVMSDFKLDKRGRKYKAHRSSMGRDADMNEGLADDAFAALDAEIENKKNPKPSSPVTRREKPDDFDKAMMEPTDKDPKDATYIVNGRKVDRKTYDDAREAHLNKAKDPRESELDDFAEKMRAKAKSRQNNSAVKEDVEQVDEVALKPEHRAAIKRLRPSGEHSKTMLKHSSGKQIHVTREGDNVHFVTHEVGAGTGKKTTMKFSQFDEEVEQVDELKKSTLRSYLKKAVPSHGDEEFISRVSKDPEEKAIAKRIAGNRAVGIIRANRGLKSAHVATMKEDVILEGATEIKQQSDSDRAYDVIHKETGKTLGTVYTPGKTNPKHVASVNGSDGRPLKSGEFDSFKEAHNFIKQSRNIDEARGRPAGAATLAKRAAAAAKPQHDDDEGEHYDADSGVEADQHIHVQLKKASDSDQKPFEVSFKNGKKHTVSQKVAKDILGATERLKPEHRKNVHDEIHQSYDNLMSVHRLIAGK